jgi:hypothetical protein
MGAPTGKIQNPAGRHIAVYLCSRENATMLASLPGVGMPD